MTDERDLAALLRNMQPEMQDGIFVFCTIAEGRSTSGRHRDQSSSSAKRKARRWSIRREEADAIGLPHQFPSRLITLTVHSALDATGFLAAVTARLAAAGISVNAVSAFYHDHLFVPEQRAEEALRILQDMSRS